MPIASELAMSAADAMEREESLSCFNQSGSPMLRNTTRVVQYRPHLSPAKELTFVHWPAAIEETEIQLTTGIYKIKQPPPLPSNYRMVADDSWHRLEEQIYEFDRRDSYSFRQLDRILSDVMCLEQRRIYLPRGPEICAHIHQRTDYVQWAASFDDAWEYSEKLVATLINAAGGRPLAKSVGPRSLPPSPQKLLAKALKLASGAFLRHDVTTERLTDGSSVFLPAGTPVMVEADCALAVVNGGIETVKIKPDQVVRSEDLEHPIEFGEIHAGAPTRMV